MDKLLDIIIPQYKETDDTLFTLLASIARSIAINQKEIGIIIVNDHSDVILSKELFEKFPMLEITYLKNDENMGPGRTRQHGLDHSKAKYVMFMDSDDTLYDNKSLYLITSCIKDVNPYILITDFVYLVPGKKEPFLERRNGSEYMQYLHGKVFDRDYLVKNNIRFSNNIKMLFEDKYFTSFFLATLKDQEKIQYVSYPTYIWKMNVNSITNSDKETLFFKTIDDNFTCITECYEIYKRYDLSICDEYIVDAIYGYYQIITADNFNETSKYINQLKEFIKINKDVFINYPNEKKLELYNSQLESNLNFKIKTSKTLDDFELLVKEA